MTTPDLQTALLFTAVAQPLTLTTTHPVPAPSPSQIQVRVAVAGLNPHDARFRDTGILLGDALPAILANDVVGVVTALGSAVPPSRFAVGDRVAGLALMREREQAGLQQYAVLDAESAARLPAGTSDDEAAELPTNVVTMALALFDSTMLGLAAPWDGDGAGDGAGLAGTALLVVGGGSNCGRFAVQLAALAGVGSIVVVGGDERELKSYGASHVIDRHVGDEELVARVREVVGDELLYAVDAVSMPDGLHTAINALSSTRQGKLARLIPFGAPDESKIHDKKEGYRLLDVTGYPRGRVEVGRPVWANLTRWLQEGKIKPAKNAVVKEGLDADVVNAVLDAYRDGKMTGKTNIHIA